MEAIFLKILNMSITAGYLAIVAIILRLFFKKAPKWIMGVLWTFVAIRLICPLSVESVLSLIPSVETIPQDIMITDNPEINSGLPFLNTAVNPVISDSLSPNIGDSVNPMQLVVLAATVIWIAGMASMLIYAFVSILRVQKRVRAVVPIRENIWSSDYISTPFILGIIHPRIYVPSSVREEDMQYIIAHEKAHLKRRDNWWKPFGFLLLSVYWFNPVLWAAYALMCKDIELACDERVIKQMGDDNKKLYSDALINCSVSGKIISACPLAFGETGVKERVKSILNYKKPAVWIIGISIVICIAVAVCMLTNPVKKTSIQSDTDKNSSKNGQQVYYDGYIEMLREKYPQYFDLPVYKGLEVYVCQFAGKSYSFGLMAGTDRTKSDIELCDLKLTSDREMMAILSTYDIPKENIFVIPFFHPLSSYIYTIGDNYNYDDYIINVRRMLGISDDEDSGIITVEIQPVYYNYSFVNASQQNDNMEIIRMIREMAVEDPYIALSSIRSWPVLKIDSKKELEAIVSLEEKYFLPYSQDGTTESFAKTASLFDDEYFKDNSLLVVCIFLNDNSVRYLVNTDKIICDDVISGKDNTLYIRLWQLKVIPVPNTQENLLGQDTALVGFITIPFSKEILENYENYVAFD